MLLNFKKDMFERVLFSNVMTKNSNLFFSIEQWELTRRLKNSGLSKEQLCQAFDDIERIEKDLGAIYNIPVTSNNNVNNINSPSSTHSTSSASSSSSSSAMSSSNPLNRIESEKTIVSSNTHGNSNANTSGSNSDPSSIVNAYFASQIDPEVENRQIEEFRAKGEVLIHSEISFFVYKHDLKQSQISRMAGVNQAYVSKFLRGEFFDLSENGKSLIYKWYLRFSKSPLIYLQSHNIVLTSSSEKLLSTQNSSTATHISSYLPSNASSLNVSNNASDNTSGSRSSCVVAANLNAKRTRFSFKSEHLVVSLFISNKV